MSVTSTGAGLLSLSGEGVGYADAIAAGAGLLSLSGEAAATAAAAAIGTGTLSLSGAGVGKSGPVAIGDGTLSLSGAGNAYTTITVVGDGTLSLSGAATAAVGVSATGDGTLSLSGSGGDIAVATGAGTLSFSGAGTATVGAAAAGVWLYLHTIPPAQVYQIDALRGRMNPALPMMRIPFAVSDTAAQIGQQNDSFRVDLDRPSVALRSTLAEQAPYGVRVDVMSGGELSRTGTVSAVDVDAAGQFRLDCESSAWADDLPLRTNADLGIFRDLEKLPLRYGRGVVGKCVRIGSTGKLWLWADHASSRITRLLIDGVQYDGWSWRNTVDASGNPYTLIETVDPLSEGDELTAAGDGALDSLSGSLMTNPADIVRDICRRGGIAIDRGDLIAFRTECQSRQIEIAGTIDGGSLQSALVSIADSIHAVFGRNMPGLMRLRPRSSPALTIRSEDTPTASAQRAPIATRLRVRYALEDGQPRASIEVRAPAVETLRGVVLAEVTLPWVRDARTAADVADRMLQERARPRYTIRAARNQRRIVPGDVVTASVPALGITGAALVVSSAIAEVGSTPVLELSAGTAPVVEITSSATAYTPESYAGATVATSGSERTITVTGPDGRPIAGAQCTLNGATTRFSDGAGRVSFPLYLMPPGTHTIRIVAAGMEPIEIEVIV